MTTNARTNSPFEGGQVYGRIFEIFDNGLDGSVEAALNVDSFVVVGGTLVLVKFADDMAVE